VTTGNGVTVTVWVAVTEPQPFVAVTVYVPDDDTVMAEEAAPVFHKYELPPDAVSTTLLPVQIFVLPLADIIGDGRAIVFIIIELLTLPQELLAVTRYVPPVVTVMESFVEPVDHK
jgi:hypothetical protein